MKGKKSGKMKLMRVRESENEVKRGVGEPVRWPVNVLTDNRVRSLVENGLQT